MQNLNPDTLRLLCIKLDDTALHNLGRTGLQREVTSLLGDNSFWYERTQFLVDKPLEFKKDVDWTIIYYVVKRTVDDVAANESDDSASGIFSRKYIAGLKYLPALLVLLSIYGPPAGSLTNARDILQNALEIKSVEVLQYIIDNGYIVYTPFIASGHLEALTSKKGRDDPDTVAVLLSLIPGVLDKELDSIAYYLLNATRNGYIKTVKFITEVCKISKQNQLQALKAALSSGSEMVKLLLDKYEYRSTEIGSLLESALSHPDALALLLEKANFSNWDIPSSEYLFGLALQKGDPETVRLLIRAKPRIATTLTREDLLAAVRANRVEIIPLLLRYVDPSGNNNEVLREAADLETLRALLADPRIDPLENVVRIITSTIEPYLLELGSLTKLVRRVEDVMSTPLHSPRYKDEEERRLGSRTEVLTDTLVHDKRFRIEKLSIEVIRLLFWALEATMEENVNGFLLGALLASGDKYRRSEVQSTIEQENNLFGIVLSFVLLKRPSNSELVEWMIELRNSKLILAAKNIVEGRGLPRDTELIPIQALMSCVLYPSLTLQEVIEELRDQGASDDSLLKAGELVGAYLCERGIRERERKLAERRLSS